MRIKFSIILSLLLNLNLNAHAYDCSKHQDFPVVETQKVFISVGHFYWTKKNGKKVEVNEQVCETEQPLFVKVLDIRGREEEWYYCQKDGISLTCKTQFRGKNAKIYVRPAIVLRNWNKGVARDTHFHAYLEPQGDSSKYHDLFARIVSPNLEKSELTLDSAGGGRGKNSNTDSYYVRVDFTK